MKVFYKIELCAAMLFKILYIPIKKPIVLPKANISNLQIVTACISNLVSNKHVMYASSSQKGTNL